MRVAEALADPNQSSEFFAALLAEVADAISQAEQAGKEALARSLDPSVLDPTARGVAHDSEYVAQRYRNATTALQPLHAAAREREELALWTLNA